MRHLGVLKGAGLVTERRDGNRILYSLVEERPASCVGRFLSAVCPEQIVPRHTRWRFPGRERGAGLCARDPRGPGGVAAAARHGGVLSGPGGVAAAARHGGVLSDEFSRRGRSNL
ncbi:hypothetical protein [Nonomuraea sp. NPDC050202]|uniref:hypothetical protein n=1 Tax=Nonomuraea sp. NPDC050202 TaxID=3155035 RepID=UPI0033C7D45E